MKSTDRWTCLDCEEEFNWETEGGDYSAIREGWLCAACVENDGQYASTAWHITPDGEITRYTVTDSFVYITEYGEEVGEDSPVTRTYTHTDGWRGYYTTRPVGEWTEYAGGWTTGDWGDAVSNSKQAFNRWAEALLAGEILPPFEVWLVADLTSNVFSTAITIYIPTAFEDIDVFDVPEF